MLCCGYTLTDFPISIRLTSLALWQSNDCPSASKATQMNMDKYFMWIHYERLHNHNKAKYNKTVYIFLGIYCMSTVDNNDYWSTLHFHAPWYAKLYIEIFLQLTIRSHMHWSHSGTDPIFSLHISHLLIQFCKRQGAWDFRPNINTDRL